MFLEPIAEKARSNGRNRPFGAMLLAMAFFGLSPYTLAEDQAGGGLLGDYFRSTRGEFTAFSDFHTHDADPGVRNERATLWTRLILENDVSLSDSIRFETELVLTLSVPNLNSGAFTSTGVVNPEPPFADFRTFMLTWQGAKTEIKLGKGVIELGYAELFTPVDRFGSQNYSKPQHFYARGDVQLSISRYFETSALTFTVLPYNEDFIDPPGGSRWLNSSGDRDFFSNIGAPAEDRPDSFPEDWGYLLKYNGIARGVDYYLGAHYGQGAYPVIQFEGIVIPPKTTKIYPRASSLMAGLIGTRGGWSYYADVLYQRTREFEDDSFVRWALGFSYRESTFARKLGLIEIRPVLTWSGHHVTEESNPRVTVHNSESARPHPNSLLGRLEARLTDQSMLYLLGAKNFSDRDGSIGFGYQYNYSDSLQFNVLGLFMRGEDNTQFGRWRDNDFISLGLSYRF